MRLVWHSNSPTTTSAYGQQTAMFVPRIAALGHELVIAGPYSFGGQPIEWNGFTVLPCARDTAGNDTIIRNHEYFKADWTITLADPFGLLRAAKELSQVQVAAWAPVDCSPAGEGDVTFLRDSGALPVAMSKFGEQVLKAEGCETLFCPHAVDTALFKPGDRDPYRDSVAGIGPDTFVVGIVAMNRDLNRKAWSEQLYAFSRFHARHPDSHLALHTSPVSNPGVNLPGMAARLGVGSAISFPDAYLYDMNMITQEQLATFYNGLDLLSLCSYGEGFGLPLIEAQACGVPVAATDASAMSELCGAGWLVSGTPFWAPGHGAWWKRPDASDIEQAYEAAWTVRQDAKAWAALKESARAFALTYDIDRVFEQHMTPVLKQLEERIDPAKALSS